MSQFGGKSEIEVTAKDVTKPALDSVEKGFDQTAKNVASRALGAAASVGGLVAAFDKLYSSAKAFNAAGADLVADISAIRESFGDLGSFRLDELSRQIQDIEKNRIAQLKAIDKQIQDRNIIEDLTEAAFGNASDELRRQEVEKAASEAKKVAIEQQAIRDREKAEKAAAENTKKEEEETLKLIAQLERENAKQREENERQREQHFQNELKRIEKEQAARERSIEQFRQLQELQRGVLALNPSLSGNGALISLASLMRMGGGR